MGMFLLYIDLLLQNLIFLTILLCALNYTNNPPFGLVIFGGIFEKICCSRVFRLYFGIFLENILGYLRVEEFLEYILRYFLKF